MRAVPDSLMPGSLLVSFGHFPESRKRVKQVLGDNRGELTENEILFLPPLSSDVVPYKNQTTHRVSSKLAPIAAGYSFRRQDKLPELIDAGPEAACTGQQVKAPHTTKALAVTGSKGRPRLLKALMPSQQSGIVVGTEMLHILNEKSLLARIKNLAQ